MPGVKHFVAHAIANLADAHDTIIESQVHQTHHTNHHQCKDNSFSLGEFVYIFTADLSLLKGYASKLLPKYVGPFNVLKAQNNMSTYRVDLPTCLCAQNLHDRFHCSKLHPYHMNDDILFPYQKAHVSYDFDNPDNQEWLVDKIITHKWDDHNISFQVQWNLGNTTCEPLTSCEDLQALDDYLRFLGVQDWHIFLTDPHDTCLKLPHISYPISQL